MTLSTTFDDLPDLVLIEIFSYLSSFDILWGLARLNQRITLLLIERNYFRCIDLSSSRYYQFNRIVQVLLLNEIESLTIDINASPLQISHWPYLPHLTTLRLKGVRDYNDTIIFLLVHAATLTHLAIDTRLEFNSAGLSLKVGYPLCTITSLLKNIIFRHLHSLRSLDLGINQFNQIQNWRITNIPAPVTFLRIALDSPRDLLRLMLTRPLSETLKQLHITLSDIRGNYNFCLPTENQLVPMVQLHTFTLVKSFLWKLKNELRFVDMLTNANIMPMLRRINLAIALNNDELNHVKQCSIFNDHRCVDVHFALCFNECYEDIKLKKLIPNGSLSHPRKVMGSIFNFNYWDNIGYFRTPHLSECARYEFNQRLLWYTLPWSFEKFFQLSILNRRNHEREVYASLSSSNQSLPPNISTLNEQAHILPLSKLAPCRTRVLEHIGQLPYYIDTTFHTIIPADRIIKINSIDRLSNYLYTANLRSIHMLFYFSRSFAIMNWNSLDAFSVLPLLKSLRITVYNLETILEDKDCQIIVDRVSMITDFVFCFRRMSGPVGDNNDPFKIHRKSISNLHQHISIVLFDQQPKIVIEADGCGLTMWL